MPPPLTLPPTTMSFDCANTGAEAANRFATRMQRSFCLMVFPLADQEAATIGGRVRAVDRVVAVHAAAGDESGAHAAVRRTRLGHGPALARAVERRRVAAGHVAVLAEVR